MNNERVLLINAPSPASRYTFSGNGNYGLFPALGVISLGTRLRRDHPNLKVKVLDGGIFTTEHILQEIDSYRPDILCLSVLTLTYKEGLKIAKYAKRKHGSTTILGNDHASIFPELILKKRSFVDWVIKSEIGEPLLSSLIGKLIGKKDKLSSSSGTEGIFIGLRTVLERALRRILLFPTLTKVKKIYLI